MAESVKENTTENPDVVLERLFVEQEEDRELRDMISTFITKENRDHLTDLLMTLFNICLTYDGVRLENVSQMQKNLLDEHALRLRLSYCMSDSQKVLLEKHVGGGLRSIMSLNDYFRDMFISKWM